MVHLRVLVANEGVQIRSSFAVRATRPRAIISTPYKRRWVSLSTSTSSPPLISSYYHPGRQLRVNRADFPTVLVTRLKKLDNVVCSKRLSSYSDASSSFDAPSPIFSGSSSSCIASCPTFSSPRPSKTTYSSASSYAPSPPNFALVLLRLFCTFDNAVAFPIRPRSS